MSDTTQRTDDVCSQLTRYGGGVYDHRLLDVLDAIVDLNDDLWHARHSTCINENIDKAIERLNAMRT